MSMRPIIGIAGFGLEGRAVYAHFVGKADIHIFDEAQPDIAGVDAVLHAGLSIPAEIGTLYKSPGIPSSKIILASEKTRVTTLMELVLEQVADRAIGITGTKGKSTVASLIHHILRAAGRDAVLMGNIGVADLALLEGDAADRIYVLELSSYQCEYLTHSPRVALLTNFYPEHLSHHGSLDKYREAKLNIARYQREEDVFINGSNLATEFAGRVIEPDTSVPFETPLLGAHNQRNCALALAAVREFGVSEEDARRSIASFEPLPYRLEKVAEHRGISFYDDSLATVPEATLASIAALPRVDTLIMGGQDRGISFDAFAAALGKTDIKTLIIFPETGARMVANVGDRTIVPVQTMEEAVRAAYEHTPENGIALLSNASPSFNLFRDYKDKSAQYRAAIAEFGGRVS